MIFADKPEGEIFMKKIIAFLLTSVIAVTLMACGKVTLHCDGCGKEVRADAKMDEGWIIYCNDCAPEFDFD